MEALNGTVKVKCLRLQARPVRVRASRLHLYPSLVTPGGLPLSILDARFEASRARDDRPQVQIENKIQFTRVSLTATDSASNASCRLRAGS